MLLPCRRQINITGNSGLRVNKFTCLKIIKFNFMKKILYNSQIRHFFPVHITPYVKLSHYRENSPLICPPGI